MSAKLNIKAASGGSVSLVVDDTLTTDEEFNVSEGGIENGSSTGGSYTKLPDGTLICYGFITNATSVGTFPNVFGTSAGSIDRAEVTILWPHQFVGSPNVTATPIMANTDTANNPVSIVLKSVDFEVGVFRVFMPAGYTRFNYIAIGRWK